jgi:hypothetical protein
MLALLQSGGQYISVLTSNRAKRLVEAAALFAVVGLVCARALDVCGSVLGSSVSQRLGSQARVWFAWASTRTRSRCGKRTQQRRPVTHAHYNLSSASRRAGCEREAQVERAAAVRGEIAFYGRILPFQPDRVQALGDLATLHVVAGELVRAE